MSLHVRGHRGAETKETKARRHTRRHRQTESAARPERGRQRPKGTGRSAQKEGIKTDIHRETVMGLPWKTEIRTRREGHKETTHTHTHTHTHTS